jgi:hypothetical protein
LTFRDNNKTYANVYKDGADIITVPITNAEYKKIRKQSKKIIDSIVGQYRDSLDSNVLNSTYLAYTLHGGKLKFAEFADIAEKSGHKMSDILEILQLPAEEITWDNIKTYEELGLILSKAHRLAIHFRDTMLALLKHKITCPILRVINGCDYILKEYNGDTYMAQTYISYYCRYIGGIDKNKLPPDAYQIEGVVKNFPKLSQYLKIGDMKSD